MNENNISHVYHKEWKRHDVLLLLDGDKKRGIELGVAAGEFSKRMVESEKFDMFFGVDSYEDNHDVFEYKKALHHVGLDKPYHLLRMRFSEALDLFPDNHFDFIYIDGYAHTGQLGGETITAWYPKLKVGGVLCGDDYDEVKWPLVVDSVDYIVNQLEVDLHVTGKETGLDYSKYPSWAVIKEDSRNIRSSITLTKKGKFADRWFAYKKRIVKLLK